MEGGLVGVALGGRADQVFLRLVPAADVDAFLQRVEPVVVALAAWNVASEGVLSPLNIIFA